MKVGIGYANEPDAYLSGAKVAKRAVSSGDISNPGLILAFCHGDLDHTKFFTGIQSVLGKKLPIIGGSTIGIITNEVLSYTDYPAGAAILSSNDMTCSWAYAGDIDKNEETASNKLCKKIVQSPEDKVLLTFYDSIKRPATPIKPPIMNASPLIIKGLEDVLQTQVPIIGAGILGHHDFRSTQQFSGDHVGTQDVVAAMIGGDFSVYHRIMHGCRPMNGIYHTITDMEGVIIRKVDGKPIVSVINDLYGNEAWQEQRPLKRLAIGVNLGSKFGPFVEADYKNRLIMGVIPDKEGIVIFEPDLKEGAEIQFMFRDVQNMSRSVRERTTDLLLEVETTDKTPYFSLYIDCGGRCAAESDTLTEEAEEVQKIMRQSNIPLLGFYSGSEIAPIQGISRGLDWTGVLTIFAS